MGDEAGKGAGSDKAVIAGMAGHAGGSGWEAAVDTKGREITGGLRFPEGPIACADGSFLVVEIAGRTLTRIGADGTVERIAVLGGGPNGAAIGPDGAVYVCNNGGLSFTEEAGIATITGRPADYESGWINRVDLATGEVRRLVDRTESGPLVSPNDMVFDADGGFWFTDTGDFAEVNPLGGVCYGTIDGSSCRKVIQSRRSPNGVGLSPDGRTLYYADTLLASVFAFDVAGPGRIDDRSLAEGGRLVGTAGPGRMLDSLAVMADGGVAVGTLGAPGGITIFDPAGAPPVFVALPDTVVTNLCFGGPDRRTAYVTLSSTGRLMAIEGLGQGAALNFA